MSTLTEAQRAQFRRESYLLVSGLIPDAIAEAAEAAMLRLLSIDAEDSATWTGAQAGQQVFQGRELLACYTPALLGAVEELADEFAFEASAPGAAYAINTFPTSQPWEWPSPHIDHALKEHGHKTFPRAFRSAVMTYLSDVPPHGGGTVVWPGSQALLERIAESDPARFELMWSLNQHLSEVDLGEPIELAPRRGEVLFYSSLCAHAGSRNTSRRPRLALNAKW